MMLVSHSYIVLLCSCSKSLNAHCMKPTFHALAVEIVCCRTAGSDGIIRFAPENDVDGDCAIGEVFEVKAGKMRVKLLLMVGTWQVDCVVRRIDCHVRVLVLGGYFHQNIIPSDFSFILRRFDVVHHFCFVVHNFYFDVVVAVSIDRNAQMRLL